MAGKIMIGHHPHIQITTRSGKIAAFIAVIVVEIFAILSVIIVLGG